MLLPLFLFLQTRCLYVRIIKIKIPTFIVIFALQNISPYYALKFLLKTYDISETIIVKNTRWFKEIVRYNSTCLFFFYAHQNFSCPLKKHSPNNFPYI